MSIRQTIFLKIEKGTLLSTLSACVQDRSPFHSNSEKLLTIATSSARR